MMAPPCSICFVAVAPCGSRSWSQRTMGIRRMRALATAGSKAGNEGEATIIADGRSRTGGPRNGSAADKADAYVSSCRIR